MISINNDIISINCSYINSPKCYNETSLCLNINNNGYFYLSNDISTKTYNNINIMFYINNIDITNQCNVYYSINNNIQEWYLIKNYNISNIPNNIELLKLPLNSYDNNGINLKFTNNGDNSCIIDNIIIFGEEIQSNPLPPQSTLMATSPKDNESINFWFFGISIDKVAPYVLIIIFGLILITCISLCCMGKLCYDNTKLKSANGAHVGNIPTLLTLNQTQFKKLGRI